MSSPIHLAESVRIDRPAGEVWDAIADYGLDARWRNGLIAMMPDPPGPPAVGTRVHEVVRNTGREYVADSTVTELVPGISYRFAGSGTIGAIAGGRRVEPRAQGRASVFTYEIEVTPAGAMRLLRPILGPIMRAGLRKDLAALKELLEG